MYFRDVDRRSLFSRMLDDVLLLTGCEYGFIGEVLHRADGTPYLKSWALTDIAWDEATKALYEQSRGPDGGLVFGNLDTLFGWVMRHEEPIIANDPAHDPRRGGLPPGHPPMHSFLGIPLLRDDEMIGMIGVANRPGGFDQTDLDHLQPFLSTCAHLIEVIRTDRERAEARRAERAAIAAAQRQERLNYIGRLASGVAHDVNNLIAVILMQCDELEEQCADNDEAHEGLARIREVCERATAMSERLRALRARSPHAAVSCDATAALDAAHGVLQSIAGPEIDLVFDVDIPAGTTVRLAESELLQVLLNLVGNARDAIGGPGRIEIGVGIGEHDGADALRIVVADSGPGIDPAVAGHVFEPFATTKGHGHGLGLSILQTILGGAGGTVDLLPGTGRGAAFEVLVPLADDTVDTVDTPNA